MEDKKSFDDVIIEVNNVSRCFNLARERVDSLKEYIVRRLKGNLHFDEFWALNGITFNVSAASQSDLSGLTEAARVPCLR